jgi:uncharacterized protein (UPF0248 family)
MIPIQDLLHRIQWDAEYAKGAFEIGYYDRVDDRIVRVPFKRVRFVKGEHFAFDAVEDDGAVHNVPLHRVREVWCNGELIWHREGAA